MTIEDIIQRHVDRIALLDRFLRAAHLGRRGKETPAARKVRRRLIVAIEEMVDYEQCALDNDRQYLAATTPAERAQDERAEPDWCATWDHFARDFDEVTLLDPAPIAGDGVAFDTSVGRWYYVEEGIRFACR